MTSKSCQRRVTKLPVLNTEFLKQQRINFFVEVLVYYFAINEALSARLFVPYVVANPRGRLAIAVVCA